MVLNRHNFGIVKNQNFLIGITDEQKYLVKISKIHSKTSNAPLQSFLKIKPNIFLKDLPKTRGPKSQSIL